MAAAVGASGERVAERSRELVEHRRLEQERDGVVGLAPKHLADEEVGDVAIGAREGVNEFGGLGFVAHRERRELHARRPTLGAVGEHVGVFGRDLDPDVADELPDLGRRAAGAPRRGSHRAVRRRASDAAEGGDRSAR